MGLYIISHEPMTELKYRYIDVFMDLLSSVMFYALQMI